MRVLLDTHVVIWTLLFPERIKQPTLRKMQIESAEVFFSPVSIWEIGVKHRIGAASAPPLSGSQALEQILKSKVNELPVSAFHAAAVDGLPLHHRDPFDRLLIAQALREDMFVATRDKVFGAYGVKLLAA